MRDKLDVGRDIELNAKDLACRAAAAALQVVEAAIGAYVQVDRRGQPRGESAGRAVGGIEHLDIAAQVGEEVFANIAARELRGRRVVERAADDGDRPVRMAIGIERIAVGADRGLRVGGLPEALAIRPAVVGASDAVVDLLPGVLADVIDEDAARSRLNPEGERIAQAQRPDGSVVAGGRGIEGVVRWNGAVRVNAKHFAEQITECLGVAAVGVLADAHVQLAVQAEMQAAAVVVGGSRQGIEIEQIHLAARHRQVAVGGEAADAVMHHRRRGRVININEVVGGEGRVQSDADQAALPRGIDRHGDERRGQEVAGVVDYPQAAALLGHKDPPVRRRFHGGRAGQPRAERHLGEARRQDSRHQAVLQPFDL